MPKRLLSVLASVFLFCIFVFAGADTFGTGVYATDVEFGTTQYILLGPFSPAHSGTATSIDLYIVSGSSNGILGIYDSDGGAGVPNTVLKSTGEVAISGTGWVTKNLSSGLAVTAGHNYWLAYHIQSSGMHGYNTVTAPSGGVYLCTRTYDGTFQTGINGGTYIGGILLSIRANYTYAGGGKMLLMGAGT